MVGDDICLIIDHKFKILGPNTKESSSGVPLKAILHFLETCIGSFPGQGCDILSSLNQAAAGSGGLSRSVGESEPLFQVNSLKHWSSFKTYFIDLGQTPHHRSSEITLAFAF